jgi:TRAP-type uncharacterized transport system substrate-binding protein
MKLLRIVALAFVSLLFCGSAWAAHHHHHTSNTNPPMGIATGPATGTYIAFGHDIAQIAAKVGLTINVYTTNGSIDNIQRITSKQKVGLAIVQSDVLGFLSHSKNPDSAIIASKLRLVAPFYNEEVHILARKDITSIADLAGKRVVVGSEGSGSMITAVNIFSTLGISPAKLYQIDPPRGVVAVLDDEADAMVFVGGKPVKMFKNMEALESIKQGPNAGKIDQVHFLPLNDARLLKEYKPATTIAVTAVLVSYDYTMKNESYYHQQCHNMAKLAGALQDNLGYLRAHGHPKWKEVDLSADVGLWKRDDCSIGALPEAKANPAANDNGALEKDLLSVIRGITP